MKVTITDTLTPYLEGLEGSVSVFSDALENSVQTNMMSTIDKYVPVEKEYLRKSGHNNIDIISSATSVGLTITYTGADNPHSKNDYANIQHENMNYNHPRGGQAHYLQEPVENYASHKLAKDIGKRYLNILKRK